MDTYFSNNFEWKFPIRLYVLLCLCAIVERTVLYSVYNRKVYIFNRNSKFKVTVIKINFNHFITPISKGSKHYRFLRNRSIRMATTIPRDKQISHALYIHFFVADWKYCKSKNMYTVIPDYIMFHSLAHCVLWKTALLRTWCGLLMYGGQMRSQTRWYFVTVKCRTMYQIYLMKCFRESLL